MNDDLDHELSAEVLEIMAIYRQLPQDRQAVMRRYFKVAQRIPRDVLKAFSEELSLNAYDSHERLIAFVDHWEAELT